jgi:hypothetical protein
MALLGLLRKFKYSKTEYSRCRNTNSSFSFWWNTPPIIGATEEYNGTTWTAGGNLNTARQLMGGAGIQTAALAFGGAPTPTTLGATEEYDGTSWTTSPASLATARSLALEEQEHKRQV